MRTHIIIYIIFLNVLVHCNKVNKKENTLGIENKNVKKQESEKIESFLHNFINDGNFRNKRIKFPIKGYNSDSELNKKDYKWYKEDWEYYANIDFKYKNDKNIVNTIFQNDTTFIWKLYKENSGYNIEYHFKIYNKKWFLDYYLYKNI